MGLREQLLKAGLANKKQIQKAESEAKRKEHQAKKNTEVAETLKAEKDQVIQQISDEIEQKKELDKRLNQEREEERIKKEAINRCKQLLKSNDLLDFRAELTYYFLEYNRWVRKISVTYAQKELLARGKLAIGKYEPDSFEYVLVPAYTAQIVQGISPERIVCRHSSIPDTEELDEVMKREELVE